MGFCLDFANKEDAKLSNIVSISHFDFKVKINLILIVGPMGSGKTEYAAKIYKDSLIVRKKSFNVLGNAIKGNRSRVNVFFIRNFFDKRRFQDYPENVIPYRGGGKDKIDEIGFASNSFDIENLIASNPSCGTFIIDEACFYDERLIFVLNKISLNENILFILPTLLYNFRKESFNDTAKLLVEYSDKIYKLGAYCEHIDCMEESFFSYRYYFYNNKEIPAPYFDPLFIVGGDEKIESAIYPNYATRCSMHHYLVGKEYFFSFLKPFALLYSQGDKKFLENEIVALSTDVENSNFVNSLDDEKACEFRAEILRNILELPFLAERALITLFSEYSILSKDNFKDLVFKFSLNKDYINKIFFSKEGKEFF